MSDNYNIQLTDVMDGQEEAVLTPGTPGVLPPATPGGVMVQQLLEDCEDEGIVSDENNETVDELDLSPPGSAHTGATPGGQNRAPETPSGELDMSPTLSSESGIASFSNSDSLSQQNVSPGGISAHIHSSTPETDLTVEDCT